MASMLRPRLLFSELRHFGLLSRFTRSLLHGKLNVQSHCLYLKRNLTVQETSTALRPFYFAVHPDLFGRYPKERAVNEDSMKKLRQHLESLHQKRTAPPTHVTFYVRSATKEGNTHKKIQINLHANTVRGTVVSVLKSCDLSLDYVENISIKYPLRGRPDRPIIWDASFYNFYNIPNPFAARAQPKMDRSIRLWLKKNIEKAHKNMSVVEPVRLQTSMMVNALKSETGLSTVLWDSSWGPAQFRACLLSLQRIFTQHKDEINLDGKQIIFCSETGISLHGVILLRTDDVQDTWIQAIKSFDLQPQLLEDIRMAEENLSRTLNDIQVVRPSKKSAILAREYVQQINRLRTTVLRYFQEENSTRLEENLCDIKITINCAAGSLMIGCDDSIMVPSSCPGFMLIEFIQEKAPKVRQTQFAQKRIWEEKLELMEQVTSEFSLLSLTYDLNVTWPQTKQCCNRLLEHASELEDLLEGCRLKIAQFYSVMSDGEIYIPWNWKEE